MTCLQCKAEIVLDRVRFCPFCGANLSEQRPEERRSAVIVFADLSGFTALSQKHDPDTFRRLIDQVMKRFTAQIHQRGGVVDKVIGDAILFVFNAERSYGDDPVRAIETIEALREELATFNRDHQLDLDLHVGAAFGTVSVGTVGTARTVMGDPVNLASRLLSVAKAGETVVSQPFAELLGHGYRLEKLGLVELKGIALPVTPYRYLGKVSFHEKEPPFVGRTKELEAVSSEILGSLERKREGNLLIVAPAGMGKSRFLSVLRERLAGQAGALFSLYFEEEGTAWHLPFRKLTEGMMPHVESAAKGAGLRLWHFAGSDPGFWEQASAEQVGNLLVQMIKEIASRKTVLLLCEDLHRASRSTQTLLERIRVENPGLPLFVVATSRGRHEIFPEALELEGLGEADSIRLFAELTGEREITPELRQAVLRCGGNPLFLRELARGVRMSLPPEKVFSGNIGLMIASALDALAPEDQELVKRAAMFGSRTPVGHLSALAGIPSIRCLRRLEPLGLFHHLERERTLVFQHDLVREAAYERTNLGKRKEWHGAIAAILEGAKAFPEEIAHHWLRSDRSDKAMVSAVAAGTRLAQLGRFDEAATFLGEGERLARGANDGSCLLDALEARFEMTSKRQTVHKPMRDLHANAADEGIKGVAERAGRIALLRGKFLFERGMNAEARREVETAKRELGDAWWAKTRLLEARTLMLLGEQAAVARLATEALASDALTIGERGVFWNLLGHISYSERRLEEAEERFQKALKAAREGGDLKAEIRATHNLGNVAFVRRDYRSAETFYSEASALAVKTANLSGYCDGLLQMAWTKQALLDFEGALANYRQLIGTLEGGFSEAMLQRAKTSLAFLLQQLGDCEEAERLATEAVDSLARTEDPSRLALALRLSATLKQERGDLEGALETIERACDVARPFRTELQNASLVRAELLFRLGSAEKAREGLRLFTESFDEGTASYKVRAKHLHVSSVVSKRRDARCLEELRRYLRESAGESADLIRFALIVEALEYGPDDELIAEGRRLLEALRATWPEAYRERFDQKFEVRRFRELTGE